MLFLKLCCPVRVSMQRRSIIDLVDKILDTLEATIYLEIQLLMIARYCNTQDKALADKANSL